ncbi:U-box domain-containing protein 4 [Acorus gramineus]|uniref:U-box domain-containing protein 4 n=1 Tax=Acorus gramineus TaxID=55184 RepID=A0AAV9BM30_ACOGR|nr:U-box domain-containing protein 4 [Acorus gramineus]
MEERTAQSLVHRLSSASDPTSLSEALAELRLLSKHDPDIRPLLISAGAVPLLLSSLSSSVSDQENAVAALLNLSISSRASLMSSPGLLDGLSHVLRHGLSPPAVQSSAAALFSLLTVEDYRPVIGSRRDIVSALIDLIRPQNPKNTTRSVKDALKALFGIALHPPNRSSMVGSGAVPALFDLIMKDGRIGVVEDSTAVIAQVAGCEESVGAFREVFGVVILVDLVDPAEGGSSARTRENAASALLNLARFGGEGVVKEIRRIDGSMGRITDLMENGSARAKAKAGQLIDVLLMSSDGWDRWDCTEAKDNLHGFPDFSKRWVDCHTIYLDEF